MRLSRTFAVLTLVFASSGLLLAQDPVKTNPEVYKVLIDNASVRVLEVNLKPGAKTSMHSHPDAVIVSLAAGKTRFTTPDGKSTDADMANESATYAPAGSHVSTNMGGVARAIVVEFKGAGGKATLPTSRPDMAIKVLAEGPRALAYRSTVAPSFSEPAGTKHDYDQVVIALTPGQVSLSIDGKPAKTKWARGDVEFIGRGVAHESKNTGGKPVDMILVAIK